MTTATCILLDQLVVFVVGGQRYALPIDVVQEIQQIVEFTDAGGSAGPVLGMVNLRGEVIPALDLRCVLGVEAGDLGLETPMLIVRTTTGPVALVVDEVDDVLAMPAGCLQEPPALHALGARLVGVARIGDATVNVLDIDRILADVAEVA